MPAAKFMNITIDDEGAYTKVTIVLMGPEIREYVSSGEWNKEQAELMERLAGFQVVAGSAVGNRVKLQLLIPKEAFVQKGSIAEMAERILRGVLETGWREEKHVVTARSVEFQLSV